MRNNFTFNNSQEEIIQEGVEHLLNKGGEQVFEYSGEAGTGKSVVMHEIWRRSNIPMIKIAPMAYIGQAAIIMRLKGFPYAKTIHSWIYNTNIDQLYDKKNNQYRYNNYIGSYQKGLVFTPKDLTGIEAIFIDESGTVPLSLKHDIERHNIKIIAAGDANQLPPVADSPAYLYDTSRIRFLTEVMRQKEGSSIIYIGKKALNCEPIMNGFYGDALVIYEDELSNDILIGADMILCGTNSTRDRLTKLIRNEILGINSTLPMYGEKIICRSNDWAIDVNGIGLGNGLIGTVANVPDISSYDGEVFYIDFKPDLFNGIFTDLDINYEYLNAKCTEKNKIKRNPYLRGHLFDYAYVNTVHLTQGGSYPKVIYFEENVFPPEVQRRLNYTACTRASNALIYVKKRYRKYYPINNK